MDKINEVKRLKKLLDDGIITEEDFANQKRKLFELEEAEQKQEKKEGLKFFENYEKELIEELRNEEKEKIEDNKEDSKKIDYYEKERLKAKARLEAQEEIRKQRIEQRNTTIKKGVDTTVNKTKIILKWIITAFLIITGIGAFMQTEKGGAMYIIDGILCIILGLMACPAITTSTTKMEIYTKYKKGIVIVITILLLILLSIEGNT